jgi:outer membrane receptor protein involved in Fe transport
LPAWRDESLGAVDNAFANNDMPRWQTDMVSFVGEDQWKINDQWTTFVGGRVDKHTYTNWLFSPRGAVVYSPNSKDEFKLMASQSLRTNTEEAMKVEHLSSNKASDPEIMRTYELRYERQQNENLTLGASIFYNNLQVLDFDQNSLTTKNIGEIDTIGAEGEMTYRTHDTDFTFSHSFVKLVNFKLDAGDTTFLSAAPAGFGWDLANFPQQQSKITAHRQLNQKLSIDGSIRIDWNFPGDKDFVKKFNANPPFGDLPFDGFPTTARPGWNPFGPSAFLDLGLQYKFNEHASLRLDAYNVLGWANKNLNKRVFIGTQWYGQFRDEAPALGITFKYEF